MRTFVISSAVIAGALFIGAVLYMVVFASEKNDFMKAYTANNNAVLIDVRTPQEYERGHIPGAINVDFYAPDFPEKLTQAIGTKNVFLYCQSGNRSAQAKAMLAQKGIEAKHLEGGLLSYEGELE